MDDENNPEDVNPGQDGQEGQTLDVEALTAQITEKVKAELEPGYKKELAGRDRRITELEKENQAKEDSKKSLEQQNAEAIAAMQAQIAEANRAKVRAELYGLATEMLASEGVKTKFVDRLIGEDREETQRLVSEYITEHQEQLAAARQQWDGEHGIKPRSSESTRKSKLTDDDVERMIRNPDGSINLVAYEKIRDQL